MATGEERGGRRPSNGPGGRGAGGNREQKKNYGNRENTGSRGNSGNRENTGSRGNFGNRENSDSRGNSGNRENSDKRGNFGGRGNSGNREYSGSRERQYLGDGKSRYGDRQKGSYGKPDGDQQNRRPGGGRSWSGGQPKDAKAREQQPDKMEIMNRLEREKKAVKKKTAENRKGKPGGAKPAMKVKRTNNIDWTREYENDSYENDDAYYKY